MKKKLYKAFESVTPNMMDRVLQACPAPEKKETGTKVTYRTDFPWYRNALSTAAAALLLVSVCGVGVWLIATGRLSATVDPTVVPTDTQPTTQQTLPPGTTEPTADTTLPPETTEPLPTDDTEINAYPWYVETPDGMAYEEFFGQTRVLTASEGSTWIATTGTEYILRTTDEGLQVWQNNGGRAFYNVPGFEGPDCGVTPAFCNGNTAYVYSDTQLLQLDVMTGEYTVEAEFDRVMGTSGRGPYLMYFAAVTGEKLSIYRIYVPTGAVELLCSKTSAKTAPFWFEFGTQKTTEDPVIWEMINPKVYTVLEQEIRNTGSVLLEDADIVKNFGALWVKPETLDEELQYDGRVADLLRTMQEKFGLNALVRCSYDPITGEYTEKEGVMDDCWFGSGMRHDHFDFEETAEIIPTVIDTKVTTIEGLTPPAEDIANKMREEQWGQDQKKYTVHSELYDFYYLCIKENGNYRRVCDAPLRDSYEVIHTANGTYLATVDGNLLWVDNQENVTQIYKAQFGELRRLQYHKGKLCAVDGDHIVMLDLLECTCSVILYHPGTISMNFESDTELYVTITLGLDISAYIFNFETGKLAQTLQRL